jgi:hypothetical protein
MDIIEKLKKEKKNRSVFDVILKSKEKTVEQHEKPPDIEVRELNPAAPGVSEPEQVGVETGPDEQKPIREFRTEGMHEFDIDSLGASRHGALKIEYKAKINNLIDEGNIDAAIEVLEELKVKLSEEPKASDRPIPSGESNVDL